VIAMGGDRGDGRRRASGAGHRRRPVRGRGLLDGVSAGPQAPGPAGRAAGWEHIELQPGQPKMAGCRCAIVPGARRRVLHRPGTVRAARGRALRPDVAGYAWFWQPLCPDCAPTHGKPVAAPARTVTQARPRNHCWERASATCVVRGCSPWSARFCLRRQVLFPLSYEGDPGGRSRTYHATPRAERPTTAARLAQRVAPAR
jgi:hypothetical protein